MKPPDEHNLFNLLDTLEEACCCTNTICLHCQANEAIEELMVYTYALELKKKRATWRCRR